MGSRVGWGSLSWRVVNDDDLQNIYSEYSLHLCLCTYSLLSCALLVVIYEYYISVSGGTGTRSGIL